MTLSAINTRRTGQISGLLVALVVAACAALGSAYVFYSIADEARSNMDAADKDLDNVEKGLQKAHGEIQTWKQLVGRENAEAVKERVETSNLDLLTPRHDMDGLIRALEDMRSKDELRLGVAMDGLLAAEKVLEAAQMDFETNREQKDDRLRELRARLSEANSALKVVESEYKKQINRLKAAQRQANSKMRQMREDLTEDQRRHNLEVQKLKNVLHAKLDEIRSKQVSLTRADGEVLFVESVMNSVTISIGAKKGVRAGMVFRAYLRDETGKRVDKGRIRVRHVNVDSSVGEIVDTVGNEAVIPGDSLDSPLFPEGQSFCVIGIFPQRKEYRYRRWEVIELIEKFGGKVVDDVDINTDYVITGYVEKYELLKLTEVIDMRDAEEFDELQKWDVERQLGRRLESEEVNEEELQQIMDNDMTRRNDAIELRTPVFTLDDFMEYIIM